MIYQCVQTGGADAMQDCAKQQISLYNNEIDINLKFTKLNNLKFHGFPNYKMTIKKKFI